MTHARRALAAVAAVVGGLFDLIRGTEDTTEGAVNIGLILLAAAFVVADLFPLALGVPGALMVLLGSAPLLVKIRRGA